MAVQYATLATEAMYNPVWRNTTRAHHTTIRCERWV